MCNIETFYCQIIAHKTLISVHKMPKKSTTVIKRNHFVAFKFYSCATIVSSFKTIRIQNSKTYSQKMHMTILQDQHFIENNNLKSDLLKMLDRNISKILWKWPGRANTVRRLVPEKWILSRNYNLCLHLRITVFRTLSPALYRYEFFTFLKTKMTYYSNKYIK